MTSVRESQDEGHSHLLFDYSLEIFIVVRIGINRYHFAFFRHDWQAPGKMVLV
jgi:hypothetical protein